jgi:hypothetical protein
MNGSWKEALRYIFLNRPLSRNLAGNAERNRESIQREKPAYILTFQSVTS